VPSLGPNIDGPGALDPLFGGEYEAVEAGLFFNPAEFDGIKTGVVDLFPDSEELGGVAVPLPVGDQVVGALRIFVAGDVGQADIGHHASIVWSLIAVVQPGLGHSFAQAALFDELFLQCLQLLIQQEICLVNQTNRYVGDHFRRPCFNEFAIPLKRLRRLASQIADEQSFFRVLVPDPQVANWVIGRRSGKNVIYVNHGFHHSHASHYSHQLFECS